MSLAVNLDTSAGTRATNTSPPDAAARQVAQQFEALLLRQLTSSLIPSEEEEGEDSLFGGGGGMGLSKQLFAEQLADTMAQAGGVGLADVILGQLQGTHAAGQPKASKAADAVRLLRGSAPPAPVPTPDETPDVFLVSEAETVEPTPGDTAPPEAPHVRPRRVFPEASSTDAAPNVSRGRRVNSTLPGAAEPVPLHMYVKGAVRSNYGFRTDPINGKRKFHSGVDIPAPRGTPIGAAAPGRVVFAGRQRGYGNTVILEHADGTRTRYAHAERLYVTKGEYVGAGEAVGAVGSTGRSTGPHLHFEVMRGGRHLNPLKELAKDSTPEGR